MGKFPEHRRPSVAIIGTRKPSPYGREATSRLSYDLAKKGVVIISGLALGIDDLAHRAALDAGDTISTATHALEQGREVFVVPGNITSPLSAGCNRLLKQGANPVTCAEDVLEVIAPQLLKAQSILPLGNNPQETKIIELLQSGIRDGDELLSASAIPASDFKVALTMLEIAGAIKSLGANQWTLR